MKRIIAKTGIEYIAELMQDNDLSPAIGQNKRKAVWSAGNCFVFAHARSKNETRLTLEPLDPQQDFSGAALTAWEAIVNELKACGLLVGGEPAGASGKPKGRKPLSDTEWEIRFETVEKVLDASRGRGGSLPQACGWVGVAYSTFRTWHKEYKTRKTKN